MLLRKDAKDHIRCWRANKYKNPIFPLQFFAKESRPRFA